MEKYMFIFSSGDYSSLSNDGMEKHLQKWFAWVDRLKSQNRYDSGEALLPAGKKISGSKRIVTDGPFTEAKEVVGGYFVIYAKDLNEAFEMAKDFPDFEFDGTIEIREVQKFDNM
jgi:hypothetical protein